MSADTNNNDASSVEAELAAKDAATDAAETEDVSVYTPAEVEEIEGVPARKKRKLFGGARRAWANLSYTTRVTMAFALIAAMTALVAIGVLSFVWQQHFQTYTNENMASLAQSTASRIADVYEETHTLKSPQVEAVAKYAESLNSGVGVAIVDNSTGRTVYDSSSVTIGSSEDGNSGSYDSGLTLAPPMSASQQFTSAPITVDNTAVGSVRIWVYGSEALLTQADEQFRDNSYQAMVFASILAIVLASCIGFLFARSLVRPINRMTSTAKAIKEGDLSARTGLTGEDEVAHLGETFDEMADSIERDRMLERRLTTDVAHELRTPLMAIQSTVEAMVDGVFEPSPGRLETVDSEVQRLSRLVDAILKLSRLENGSTPLKKEVVDVGKLIESIISTHEAFVSDSGLTLKYERQHGVRVLGDADMIRQATANLISNAVRYTPEGGRITVRVASEGDTAIISVRDTGIGLTPEEAKMVFSRFWRADAGRTREKGGLGIGLSVVKEIVDRHNGWVDVEGEKDKGACFTMHFPLYDAEAYEREQRHAARTQRVKEQREQRLRGRAQKQQKS